MDLTGGGIFYHVCVQGYGHYLWAPTDHPGRSWQAHALQAQNFIQDLACACGAVYIGAAYLRTYHIAKVRKTSGSA